MIYRLLRRLHYIDSMFSFLRAYMLWNCKSPSPATPESSEYNTTDQTQLEADLRPILRKDSKASKMKKKPKMVRFALQDKLQDDNLITEGRIEEDNRLVKMDTGMTLYPSMNPAMDRSNSCLKEPKLHAHQKYSGSGLHLYVRDFSSTELSLRRRSSARASTWRKYLLRARSSCHTVRNEFLTRENPLFVSVQKDLCADGSRSCERCTNSLRSGRKCHFPLK